MCEGKEEALTWSVQSPVLRLLHGLDRQRWSCAPTVVHSAFFWSAVRLGSVRDDLTLHASGWPSNTEQVASRVVICARVLSCSRLTNQELTTS